MFIQTRKRRRFADPEHDRHDRHHQEVAAVDQADQHAVPRDRGAGVEVLLHPGRRHLAPIPRCFPSQWSALIGNEHVQRDAEVVVDVDDREDLGLHLRGGVRRGEAAAVVVGEQHRLERQPVDHHLPPGGASRGRARRSSAAPGSRRRCRGGRSGSLASPGTIRAPRGTPRRHPSGRGSSASRSTASGRRRACAARARPDGHLTDRSPGLRSRPPGDASRGRSRGRDRHGGTSLGGDDHQGPAVRRRRARGANRCRRTSCG